MKSRKAIGIILIFVSQCFWLLAQPKTIDLSGNWQFALDSLGLGEKEEWFNKNLPLQIQLPGTTDEAQLGEKHINGTNLYTGDPEIWQLARKYRYIGKAWYQKNIEVPGDWEGENIMLFLERCMWQTKVWVNGRFVGENHSLNTAHKFEIGSDLKTGQNTISLLVDNSPYVHLGSWSHGYSPGMQTIWNGVVGEIKLIAKDKTYLKDIQLYPSFKKQELRIKGKVINTDGTHLKGNLEFTITDKDGNVILLQDMDYIVDKGNQYFETIITLNKKLLPWDEFQPNLYTLEVKLNFEGSSDTELIRFGLCDIEAVNGRFLVNGNKIFMRGQHDGGSSPLTGYAPMDKAEWLRIFKIGKAHGLNHWRFHSWCPPKAAFEAADELGIYLQPELTLFSQDWEETLVGTDDERDAFLFEELKKLLDTYGNHPSFVFMCMGNELRGDPKVLEKWVAWGKNHDPRHLYASNANLEAMGLYERLAGDDYQVAHGGKNKGKRVERRMHNYFNTELPNTQKDFSHTLQPPFNQWPIISHEVGQWLVYPDFSEIEKYTGVWAPRNMEVLRSRLQQKGMLEQANEFLMASGKLSALLYREEMERLLRTPGMGGYQLLDLRDYQAQGSALIGILNAFWEPKGFITADEFKQSNNDITLLLEMPKRTWLNNETFDAELVVPNYSNSVLNELDVEWKVLDSGKELFKGKLNKSIVEQGEVVSIGNVLFPLNDIRKAAKLEVRLAAPGLQIENNYDIWVYPENIEEDNQKEIVIATGASPELLDEIENGATVLLVPDKGFDAERTQFTTPFWSTILFNYQVKTMGLLCNPNHPVFADFPTDFHTNWQWWELCKDASAVRLNQTAKGYQPIIQVIDHAERNDKLGAIVETKIGKGKLLVSTFDILSDLDERPVARQLKYSILNYMNSPEFNPSEAKGIKEAFFDGEDRSKVRYKQITATNENSESPIIYAFDGDGKTFWQTIKKDGEKIIIEIELQEPRYIKGCEFLTNENFNPGKFEIYIFNDKQDIGDVVIAGNGALKSTFQAKSWDNGFTIQEGKEGGLIRIEMDPGTSSGMLSLKELNWILGD